MKIGVSIKIDLTKIDKSKLFRGNKGTYLDLTTFIDTDVKGQYGDNGFISQSLSKEEREAGGQGVILGNSTVFYTDAPPQQQRQAPPPAQSGYQQPPPQSVAPPADGFVVVADGFDEDIPF
jgi:hypothetical protein